MSKVKKNQSASTLLNCVSTLKSNVKNWAIYFLIMLIIPLSHRNWRKFVYAHLKAMCHALTYIMHLIDRKKVFEIIDSLISKSSYAGASKGGGVKGWFTSQKFVFCLWMSLWILCLPVWQKFSYSNFSNLLIIHRENNKREKSRYLKD